MSDKFLKGYGDLKTEIKGDSLDHFLLRICEECSNDCIFCCVTDYYKKRGVMQLGEIKKLIDLHANKNIILELGGCEPTIHPNFLEILEYSKNKFKGITITTNVRIFSNEKFVSKLKGLENVRIKSSLHGPNPDVHDSLTRREDSFKQAIMGFKNLINNGIPVGVNFVITKKNLPFLKDTVDLLVNMGIKEIYFSGMITPRNNKIYKEIAADFDDTKEKLIEVLEKTKNLGLHIFIEKLPVCIAPKFFNNFLIESDKTHFVKLEPCKRCVYENKCMGICKDYVENGFNCTVYPQMNLDK